MANLVPTSPGPAGGILPQDAPLSTLICPECPWRKKMTPGFSTGMPQDCTMLIAATTRTVPCFTDYADGRREYGSRPMAQKCHMILDKRCRGAETYRANVGLESEVPKNNAIAESEDEVKRIWAERGYLYRDNDIVWGYEKIK